MRERRGEYYVYQQHDDHVSPTYVADLVAAAVRWPQASICYSEMEVSGIQNLTVRTGSLIGNPLARALTHLERLNTSMFRGLMRGSHLNCTGGLLINEFDSFGSDHRLMTELALAGEFRFVKGPTYFKRVHSQNLQMKFQHWSEERKRAAWAFFGAWMVEVIVPAGHSLEERWRLLNIVLDRFLVARGWLSFMRGRADWYEFSGSRERSIFVRAAINRIRKNGKLDAWLRKQRRGMFCQLSNSDAEVRAALLRNILDRLRANDKFDPSACLHSTWAVVEDTVARKFGVSRHCENWDHRITRVRTAICKYFKPIILADCASTPQSLEAMERNARRLDLRVATQRALHARHRFYRMQYLLILSHLRRGH